MSPIANTLTPQERNALQTALRRLGRPRLAQEIGISVTTLDTAIGASLQQRTRDKILAWLRKNSLLPNDPSVAPASPAADSPPTDAASPQASTAEVSSSVEASLAPKEGPAASPDASPPAPSSDTALATPTDEPNATEAPVAGAAPTVLNGHTPPPPPRPSAGSP